MRAPFSIPIPRRLQRRWSRSRRPLRLVLRSRAAHWCAAALLGLATYGAFASQEAALERRERALGPRSVVAVVRTGHRAGDLVGPDDVDLRPMPRSIVPASAVRRVDRPVRLRVDVGAGEVLVRERLASGSSSALTAALPDGWRAVGVALPDGALRLRSGDRVDVLVLGAGGTSDVVAADAIVLDAGDRAVAVAVPRRAAPALADAVLAGTVTLTLTGT